MKSTSYNVPLITQGLAECTQASITSLLNFYGINKTIEQVIKEVPVYVTEEGKPLGTSLGHMGSYLLKQSLSVTFHIVDVEIFDRTWKDLPTEQLINKLEERSKYIKHSRYDKEAFEMIFDGYIGFLKAGGKIKFPIIAEEYLIRELENGPFMAVVSYNFLHNDSKYKYDKEKAKFISDDIKGNPTTHAIVISGYKNHKFEVMDPDKNHGGKKVISSSLLIGAIYLAETDLDSLILTIKK